MSSPTNITFVVGILLCTAVYAQPSSSVSIIPVDDSAWRITIADVTGDQEKELIYGSYHGHITCLTLSGGIVWSYKADGFSFDLTTTDLDGNGQEEILTSTSNGSVIALSGEGQHLWTFTSSQAVYNVTAGKLSTEQPFIACGGMDRNVYVLDRHGKLLHANIQTQRLVHRLATGNIDRDDADELIVIDNRTNISAYDVTDKKSKALWKKSLRVPESYINWENVRGNFFAFSIAAENIDEKDGDELIFGDTYFNRQPVMVTTSQGDPLWMSDKLPFIQVDEKRNTEFFSHAIVRAHNLVDTIPGKEILAIAGGTFRLFDHTGNLLAQEEAAIGFTDFAIHDHYLYLSSSPNGDQNIYKILWNNDWKKAVRSLDRVGNMKKITNHINTLSRQAAHTSPDYQDTSLANGYTVSFGKPPEDHQQLEQYHEEQAWWKDKVPYQNIITTTTTKILEPSPPLDNTGKPWSPSRWRVDAINGTRTVDEILSMMNFLEANKVRVKLVIGHSVMPFITLNTAEKILQTAPYATYGFYTAEDEQFENLERYFRYYFDSLATLCKQYGNKYCVTKNKNVWWFNTPSHKHLAEYLFAEGNENILKAETEDSNSRTPEINLMSRLGLYLAGKVSGLVVNVHQDMFSFSRFHQWEYPKHGHPFLRLMVAHTLLGGDEYNLRIPFMMERNDSVMFTRLGKESVEVFMHLIGKNIIWKPKPEDMMNVSPLGIAVHPPSKKWITDGINGHTPETWKDDQELHNAVIPHNGVNWGMTPTPDHALQKVLFNKEYQFGQFLPETPYGLVAMVPYHLNLQAIPHIQEWWHTDGTYLWKEGGQKLTGEEAARALQESYENAASLLPFRITGSVFTQVLKKRDGDGYRIVLIDPGWLDPDDREVSVTCQLDGRWILTDRLTNENLEWDLPFVVPAGSMRILDVRSEKENLKDNP